MSTLIVLVSKIPLLNRFQVQTIVDIYINIGSICLGSVALPVIFDQGSEIAVLTGLVGTALFWYTAVRTAKGLL